MANGIDMVIMDGARGNGSNDLLSGSARVHAFYNQIIYGG